MAKKKGKRAQQQQQLYMNTNSGLVSQSLPNAIEQQRASASPSQSRHAQVAPSSDALSFRPPYAQLQQLNFSPPWHYAFLTANQYNGQIYYGSQTPYGLGAGYAMSNGGYVPPAIPPPPPPAWQLDNPPPPPNGQTWLNAQAKEFIPQTKPVSDTKYDLLRRVNFSRNYSARIDKYARLQPVSSNSRNSANGNPSISPERKPRRNPRRGQQEGQKPGRDPKIMLPAPDPTPDYLHMASLESITVSSPQPVLIVLDLNGTLVHRPSRRNLEHIIARPFVKHFLKFLFERFHVMVWSSARPQNVQLMVDKVLEEDQKAQLIGPWSRENFGLKPHHYNTNVQVYKKLSKIWDADDIQQKHPGYEAGGRWGQHNTILIDDSLLKASSEPHNLIEIPEFESTPEQMRSDILREVAGYLKEIPFESDVSSHMRQRPFKADGTWNMDWPDSAMNGSVASNGE